MFRRISALLLGIVMIAGMLPVSAFAEEPAAPESGEIITLPEETSAPTDPTEEVPPTTEPAPTEPQQTEPVPTESVPAETEPIPTVAVITDEAMDEVVDETGAEFWQNLDPSTANVQIPDGVTYIPDRAFKDFTNLKSVYIPASVTTIEILGTYYESPFYGCSSDVVIYCESASAPDSWDSNWNRYSANSSLSVKYSWSAAEYSFWSNLDTSAETIVIPDGITTISKYAFTGCNNLSAVFIPASVTTIETDAFWGCDYSIRICCEVSSEPDGWAALWNRGWDAAGMCDVYYGANALDVTYWSTLDQSASAYDIPEGITFIPDNAFWNRGSITEVRLPSTVRSIGTGAFQYCASLTSINLPAGLTMIGESAFDTCSSLKEITIPDGITKINHRTFQNCSSLTTVSIPASVTYIGTEAFYRCNALTDLYFGHMASDALSFGSYTFYAYPSDHTYFPLTVHVPTTRDIHNELRSDNFTYYTVTYDYTGDIPATGITLTEANNTTSIESGLDLYFTAALTPADCTSELVWTASNGGYVKETDYVSGTATIIGVNPGTMTVRCESVDDNSVFAEYEVEILNPTADVSGITVRSDTPYENEVEVGTKAQMIADIHPGNAAIKDVVWELENGTGTAELDENGLLTALTTGTVTVYATATDGTEIMGSSTINIVRYVDDMTLLFNGDPTKTTIGVGEPVRVTLEHFPEDATDKSVTWTLTDGTGSISYPRSSNGNSSSGGAYILIQGETAGTATLTATTNDSKKTAVSVELEVVGEKASYAVTGGNIYYNTVTGAIVGADDTVTAANIPARINGTTITSIAPDIFARYSWGYYDSNTTLTSVTIPSTVTYIGDNAFNSCTALAALRIGSGVTTIGKNAFYYCTSLANLTIPDSVTTVGYGAFSGLSSLKYLTMPGELNLGDHWFYDTLETVTFTGKTIIAQPITIYGEGSGAYVETTHLAGRNAKHVVISDSITTIEDYAFRNCSNIETVIIGNGVTTVGRHVFSECHNLVDVELGSSMTNIGYCMFYYCSNLVSVTIPDNITLIDTGAFIYCGSLTDVTLGSGVSTIMESAFYDCNNLTTINLPDSLTYIGKDAFQYCCNLQMFDLSAVPDTITQQQFPLTADLAGIPDVLVRATGGKTELWWSALEIEGETGNAGIGQDSNDNFDLYIYESGKVKLQCTDGFTGAQGYKIIDCQLGLEIDGLWENSLTAGQSVILTAYRADTNTEESVTWSLRSEDKAYASLSATSGKSTKLTAKAVTKTTQIQITAKSNNPNEAPETRTVWILPAASGVIITDADGNILGKTGTTVQTIKVDLRETGSIQLFATVYPEGASKDVSWGSNNSAIADPWPPEGYVGNFDYQNPLVTLTGTGTATLTAYATDGSNKNASVKLEVYYLDTATKFTAKTNAPTTGLMDSHTAQIQIFGTDKNTPLDPTAFDYVVKVGQEEMAFVDENGRITAGSKAGTATITATAKNDPKGRKVTINVKIIPAQTASVQLTATAENPDWIVMLDAGGEVTEDVTQAVKYRVYLNKDDVMDGKKTFQIKPVVTDTNGNGVTPTKSSLKWASTDTRVATVAAAIDGSATVTIPAKTDGACVITATSTDLAKVEGMLEIFVRDYTPRLESSTLTVNSNLTAGVSTGLTPSYGNDIVSVELTDAAAPFIVTYADDLLTVTPKDVLTNGTYKQTVKVTCEESGPYEIPLTVKVANKLPSITVKQLGKFNLFYSDSTADLQITVKNEAIRDAALAVTETSSFETSSFHGASGIMTVKFTPGYIAGTSGKLVNKVTLLVKLEGYREPVSKAISIATATTRPTVTLTPASSIINTATLGDHSTIIRAYNKTAGTYVAVQPENVTAAFADISAADDGVKLTLTEIDGKVNKGGSATILVQDTNWMQPIKLTHKLTVQTALPAVNLSATTLKLNRVFTEQSATANITLNQQNMSIGKIEIEPADKTEKLLTESRKISIDVIGNTITAKLDKANLPANGNYSFRVNVTLADGTPLAAKTFKVNVNSAVPTVKLKTPTLKLNTVLGTEYAVAASEFILTKGDGYEIAGFRLPAEWRNSDISVTYRDGRVYAHLLRNDAAVMKHTVVLTPILRHIATGEESALPTTVKLTVQVESKPLSVNVTAAGKLDATLPDSAITYTVKSFTNVSGTPSTVTLEGAHGELFNAALDTNGTTPVVTLKMRDDIKYDLKTTYKVDLVFAICGQLVRKSVSFKISQSNLKFATVKAVNLYQFQTQAVSMTITVTAPAGATIDQIALSSKSAQQFRRALGNGSMTVTPIGGGSSALVSFTLENPGYLSFGKSYAVYLDVTPVTTANTVKPAQVKLTVKSFK